MYFWRIEKLKNELAKHPVSQKKLFAYCLGITLLLFIDGVPQSPENSLSLSQEWISWCIYFTTTLISLVSFYLINGGEKGRDFIGRFLSIQFVLQIRYSVFIIASAILLEILTGDNTRNYDRNLVIISSIFSFLVMYKSITHIKDVVRKQEPNNELGLKNGSIDNKLEVKKESADNSNSYISNQSFGDYIKTFRSYRWIYLLLLILFPILTLFPVSYLIHKFVFERSVSIFSSPGDIIWTIFWTYIFGYCSFGKWSDYLRYLKMTLKVTNLGIVYKTDVPGKEKLIPWNIVEEFKVNSSSSGNIKIVYVGTNNVEYPKFLTFAGFQDHVHRLERFLYRYRHPQDVVGALNAYRSRFTVK